MPVLVICQTLVKYGNNVEATNLVQPPKEILLEDYKTMIRSKHIVLVDFWAVWCGPCRKLSPIVEKIGKERAKDLNVFKINVDENRMITSQNSIDEIPTLIWYKDGKVALRMTGLYTEKYITETLEGMLKK